MCLACEEADMQYRWQLVEQIARGEMPPGLTADDLTAMGLPQPGEIETTVAPDGTIIYRQKAPSAMKRAASAASRRTAFACDSPGDE
jgi:hypothetical protein